MTVLFVHFLFGVEVSQWPSLVRIILIYKYELLILSLRLLVDVVLGFANKIKF